MQLSLFYLDLIDTNYHYGIFLRLTNIFPITGLKNIK